MNLLKEKFSQLVLINEKKYFELKNQIVYYEIKLRELKESNHLNSDYLEIYTTPPAEKFSCSFENTKLWNQFPSYTKKYI